MAVTGKFYGKAFLSVFNKEIDLDTDTIKVMLCTSGYTPNRDTHDYRDDVTNEVSGTGYTAGGKTLSSKTVTYDAGTHTFAFDAADVSWPSSTLSARYAVIYDDTPSTNATKPLIGYVDFGADVASNDGTFSITWDAAGILTVTIS